MMSAKFAFNFVPPSLPQMDPLVPLLELEKTSLFFGKPHYPELPSSGGLGVFIYSRNHSRQGFNFEALGILSSPANMSVAFPI